MHISLTCIDGWIIKIDINKTSVFQVLALTDLGRLDDVFPLLRSVLEMDARNNIKHTYCEDVVSIYVYVGKGTDRGLVLIFISIVTQNTYSVV